MKKIERYICDYCGADYDNEKECNECEKRHKAPPSILRIKMNNGEIIEYKRVR